MFLEMLPLISLVYFIGFLLMFRWTMKREAEYNLRAEHIRIGLPFWISVFWIIVLLGFCFLHILDAVKAQAFKRWGP